MTQWSPGDVVMVLGAEATRGAEFVERLYGPNYRVSLEQYVTQLVESSNG